jgi:hypothetical protein
MFRKQLLLLLVLPQLVLPLSPLPSLVVVVVVVVVVVITNILPPQQIFRQHLN